MTIPNKITVSRLAITVVVMVLLFWETFPFNFLIATALFIIAMLTDILDGYIARKYNMSSAFGAFLDPLSDKLIILLVSFFLQGQGIYPLWLILILLVREVIMDAFRGFAVSQNVYVGAISLGKAKTLLQTISNIIGLIYLCVASNQLFGLAFDVNLLKDVSYYVMLFSIIVGVVGLFVIFNKNWSSVFRNVKY